MRGLPVPGLDLVFVTDLEVLLLGGYRFSSHAKSK